MARHSLALLLLSCSISLSSAQTHALPPPVGGITFIQVIRLSQSGLTDETIIAQIKKRPQPFDLTPDQLLTLKNAHVSDQVIEAMALSATPSAPTPLPAPAPSNSSRTPLIPDTFAVALGGEEPAKRERDSDDRPRVFVHGKGSQDVVGSASIVGGQHWAASSSSATFDSHDEAMEVTKDLRRNCSGVTVTLNQLNADYIVMLNRESKHNRGLLRPNSQVQVADKSGDILGADATHTVGNAAKDACELILSDWQSHRHPFGEVEGER